MITLFNLGDLIGRTLPNWPRFVWLSERGVVICSIIRLVFFPLFVMAVKHTVCL